MDALNALELTKTMRARVKEYRSSRLSMTASVRKQQDGIQMAIENDIRALMKTNEYKAAVQPVTDMPAFQPDASEDEKRQFLMYIQFGKLFPYEATFALNVCTTE